MRCLLALFATFTLLSGIQLIAQEKKAPTKLTFPAKMGTVTFDHTAHAKREKNDCKTCHPKLWPQDAKAPLNFKGGVMHKTAETNKTSCGACHVAGGQAFEAKGNCNKCHVKGASKG